MIFKNGTLFHTPSIKKDSNKSTKVVFKNGTLFSKIGFEKEYYEKEVNILKRDFL